MCKFLEIKRSTYYKIFAAKNAVNEVDKIFEDYGISCEKMDEIITKIYKSSKGNYGARKISAVLRKQGTQISRYKVHKVTKRLGLISKYIISSKKPYANFEQPNDSQPNIVNQNFTSDKPMQIITSDLTYIKIKSKFYYICFMVDLFSREIVSYSVSDKHNSKMVIEAFSHLDDNYNELEVFHSDRGGEFRSTVFAKILEENHIKGSMSKSGCPFDNAVSESLFNIYKREWAIEYADVIALEVHVKEFVNYYNLFRVHSSIDYMTPAEARMKYYENKCLLNA